MKKDEKKGMLHIVFSDKGGVGKTEVAQNVIAPMLFKRGGKVVTVIEADDNNVSNTLVKSKVLKVESLKVSCGIKKAFEELFEIYKGSEVCIDVGGGNDAYEFWDAFKGLGLDDECTFYIPVLKNKKGMRNLVNSIKAIREYSSSKIVIVLNQVRTDNFNDLKSEFNYFFGDKSRGIKGVLEVELGDVKNITFAPIHDTSVFDYAEDYELTAFEIGTSKLDVKSFRESEARKGFEEGMKALAFISVYNDCKKYYEKTLKPFFKECEL